MVFICKSYESTCVPVTGDMVKKCKYLQVYGNFLTFIEKICSFEKLFQK